MSFLSVCKVHYELVTLGYVRLGPWTLQAAQVRLRGPCQLCPAKAKEP